MAYEKITAYRLDDGTITESLAKAEEFDKKSAFISKIIELYQYSNITIEQGPGELASFIWTWRDTIMESLK